MKIFNATIYKAGEGAGTELVVPAIGSVQTAEVNTKVLLVYANEVGGTDIAVENNTASLSLVQFDREGMCASNLNKLVWTVANGCAVCSFDSNLNTSWRDGQDTTQYTTWDTDPNLLIQTHWLHSSTKFGFGTESAFYSMYGSGNTSSYTTALYGVPGGFVVNYCASAYQIRSGLLACSYNRDKMSFQARTYDNNSTVSGLFFINYANGLWLVSPTENIAKEIDTETGDTIQSVAVTGENLNLTAHSIGYSIVEGGEYFIAWTLPSDIGVFKMTKGSTWNIERIGSLTGIQGTTVQLIRSRETNTESHIYVVPDTCTDTENVKHFIVNKSTGEVTQAPDLLYSKGYTYILTAGFSQDMSRGSFILGDGAGNYKLVYSGLDTILLYEYAAVPFSSANLTDSAVTGFIKSQDGVDEFGNSIATVEACLDPNATPPSADRLIGMNVTVNEGEPL